MDSHSDVHVLVVEDDPQFRRMVIRMLESAGFRVTASEDFSSAIPVIESDQRIDVLLTDIGMPAGTPHGLSIGKMAGIRRRSLKVVYMSGSNPEQFALFKDETLLRKPFTAKELIATLDTVLK